MVNSVKRSFPILAKLGIASLLSVSVGSFAGFLLSTLTRESGQLLSVAVAGLLSAGTLAAYTFKRNGVISILPDEFEEPLLKWDVIQTIRFMNSSFDVEAVKAILTELAPLAVAKGDAEIERAIKNMSGFWQKTLTTKGLIGLLPPETQRLLLPSNVPLILPPTHIVMQQEPDLVSQSHLFQEFAWLRMTEFRDDLARRNQIARGAKMASEVMYKFYLLVKQNSSSDIQVTVIMSVVSLLILRILLVVTMFVIRKLFGLIYL